MKTSVTDERSILVVHSLVPPDGTTKFVDQIVQGATESTVVEFFSWRKILWGRYDVFHVHWPELTIRGKSRVRRFMRRRALDAALLRLRMTHTPLVRTVHNVSPHEEGSRDERAALRKYDRHTTLFIRLNETTQLDTGVPVVTIPHGHYRDRFSGYPKAEPVPGRLLYFGIIRPYKGVRELSEAFASLTGDDLSLRIVGSPSVGQREMVEAACDRDPRISAELRYVDDEDLVREVGLAELVTLPYREMNNSGSILVALSLDRPVLVPRTPSNVALAEEVGAEWVHLYDGEITPTIIAAALSEARSTTRATRPRLSGRDWDLIGRQHYEAYRQALRIEATKR